MDKKYIASVLVLMIIGAEGSALQSLTSPLLLKQGKWDGLGKTAEINYYVDSALDMITDFFDRYGLDPMDLPDIEEGFEVRPFLITYSAWLILTNGAMSGLTNLERFDDQSVSYFSKMVRVRLQFKARDLEFIYRYRVLVMNIGPRGGIVGSLDEFTIRLDILIDFNNDEVHLQEFALKDIGRLRVRLTGNPLVDWLINPVIHVFVRIFDNIIIRVVESNIRSAINEGITIINSNVGHIIDQLESI